MANTIHCGRQEMCGPCKGLDRASQLDVCIAVGEIAVMPNASSLTVEAVRDIAYDKMADIVDDDDYVTQEMRQAAETSTLELIRT